MWYLIVSIPDLCTLTYFSLKEKRVDCVAFIGRENLSSVFTNNKGADQPAHPRRLISTFFIHLLESMISRLAGETNIFCTSTISEYRANNWYQLNAFKPPIGFVRVLSVLRRLFCCY